MKTRNVFLALAASFGLLAWTSVRAVGKVVQAFNAAQK